MSGASEIAGLVRWTFAADQRVSGHGVLRLLRLSQPLGSRYRAQQSHAFDLSGSGRFECRRPPWIPPDHSWTVSKDKFTAQAVGETNICRVNDHAEGATARWTIVLWTMHPGIIKYISSPQTMGTLMKLISLTAMKPLLPWNAIGSTFSPVPSSSSPSTLESTSFSPSTLESTAHGVASESTGHFRHITCISCRAAIISRHNDEV